MPRFPGSGWSASIISHVGVNNDSPLEGAQRAIPSQPQQAIAAHSENDTVKDLADEAKQEDVALAIIADDDPVTLNAEEETAKVQECPHCGHYPCGCGG